jgi:glycerol uptake facilitator-like aquaporin
MSPAVGEFLGTPLLVLPGKDSADRSYAWVPILGPLLSSLLAALAYSALGRF